MACKEEEVDIEMACNMEAAILPCPLEDIVVESNILVPLVSCVVYSGYRVQLGLMLDENRYLLQRLHTENLIIF